NIIRTLRGAARILTISRLRYGERKSALVGDDAVEGPVLQHQTLNAFPISRRGKVPQKAGGEPMTIVESGIGPLASPAIDVLNASGREWQGFVGAVRRIDVVSPRVRRQEGKPARKAPLPSHLQRIEVRFSVAP